jgi:hypothetical protein
MSLFDNAFTTINPAAFAGPAAFADTNTFSTGARDNSFTVNSMTVGPVMESIANFHTQMSNISSKLIELSAPVLSDKGQLVYGVQPAIVQNSNILLTKANLAVSSLCHFYSQTMLTLS